MARSNYMGKGIIKSGGTAGLYTIDVSRDTTAMAAWLVKLQQRLADIQNELTAADAAVAAAKSDVDTAVAEMDILIDLWSEDQSNDDAINAQAKVVAEKGKDHRIAKQQRDALVLDQASIQKQIEAIEAVETLIETTAWCADYTEDLTGEVGTVEIPGDRTRLLIRPGDSGKATYAAARDGQLQPTQSSTSATVAWNYAMFPGWQKWIPQYRSATVTAIDTGANTCTVTFGAETSIAQGLDVNYITESSDVPISYMTCDHEAFEVGDLVLIEFESVTETGTVDNWANPKVIGFIDNPKECPTTLGFRVHPNPGCEDADNDPECWYGWGAPFDDGGEPPVLINPPWGTVESSTAFWSLLVNQGGWQHWRNPQTTTWNSGAGSVDWQGSAGLVSWIGGTQGPDDQGSRYRIHDHGFSLWYEGRHITSPNFVHGACVREFNGEKYIISASDTNNDTKVNVIHVDGTHQWQTSIAEGTYDLSGGLSTGSFWLFNSSGTAAVQIREYSGSSPTHGACSMTAPVWRRKLRLTVSLRVGGGGVIVPDLTITDLGDEMPVFVEQPETYVFNTADRGAQGTMQSCRVGGFDAITINITGLLEDESWDRNNDLSFSYKFYDYKGDTEVSAEFWNTRTWQANHWESPCPINLISEYYDCGSELADRRTGTNDSTFVTQEFPIGCSGSATNRCGVRFTGGVMADLQWESLDSFTGTGTSASDIIPENGFESRPSFGNTRNTLTVSSITQLSLAVPYMDMRFGQLIAVVERKTRDFSDSHSFDYTEPVQNEFYDQSGSITVNLTITLYSGGSIVGTEEREDITAIVQPPSPSHLFNPYLSLSQNIHRKCRGYHGRAVRPDYLFQGPQIDPRPMASAGGSSKCVSYVDRWVKDDESDAPNEHIPPIRSVINFFPVALNIPGTFPNAAPVFVVEPSS